MMAIRKLSFEKVDSAGQRSLDVLFLLSALLGIAGLIAAFRSNSYIEGGVGLTLIGAAIVLYRHLVRAMPKTRYFRYFWLNEQGVHHVENSDPTTRVSRFSWHEIENVEVINSSQDVTGIEIFLNRQGMREVPIYLSMTASDAAEAAKAISGQVKCTSGTAPDSSLHTDASRQ